MGKVLFLSRRVIIIILLLALWMGFSTSSQPLTPPSHLSLTNVTEVLVGFVLQFVPWKINQSTQPFLLFSHDFHRQQSFLQEQVSDLALFVQNDGLLQISLVFIWRRLFFLLNCRLNDLGDWLFEDRLLENGRTVWRVSFLAAVWALGKEARSGSLTSPFFGDFSEVPQKMVEFPQFLSLWSQLILFFIVVI